MILRSSLHLLPPAIACLALHLGSGAALRAGEAASPAEAMEKPSANETAHPQAVHAEAAPAVELPKRAKSEIQGLLNLGASLTDRGDYAAADIAFRQVLNAPNATETEIKLALLGLAHMHRKQGALTKAVAIYERFLKDYPGDERTPDTLLALGRTLRDLGIYKHAVSRFYSVITSTLKPPTDGLEHYQALAKTAQFEIAETHFQFGEFAEANKFYAKFRLLDIAPADRARAQFKAGYALRLQGDLEGAVTTFRAYLSQWPGDENGPEARHLLATSLRELKRPQEALAVTLELLSNEQARRSADPKRWTRWQLRTGNQLANDFFENGDTVNAQAIYGALLNLSSDVSWRLPVTYQLALCYERMADTSRARAAYQTIVETAGAKPPPELAELVRMAAWRLEHLDWQERIGEQVSKIFESATTTQAAVTPSPSAKTAARP